MSIPDLTEWVSAQTANDNERKELARQLLSLCGGRYYQADEYLRMAYTDLQETKRKREGE